MYGNPPLRSGAQHSGKATEVPLELLQTLGNRKAYPVTIGGTSQRTFTLAASVTAPVAVWNGDDFIYLKNNVAYSWIVGSNNILDSTAAQTTLTNSTTGIWYIYLDADGNTLWPSVTAPSFVEGKYAGPLGHPGTSGTQYYVYVGYMICDATTPTFVAATKTGFWYEFAKQSVATTTSWALLDFSAVLPGHGVECGGYLETSASDNDTTEVGTSSTDGQGVYLHMNSSANLQMAPFGPLVVNSAGKFYGSSTTAAGDVHVTRVRDVV